MPHTSVNRTLVAVLHDRIPKSIQWDKFDGADLNHANQRFNVRPNTEVVYGGKRTRDNITTECVVDPIAYADFIAALNAGDNFSGTTISVTSVDAAEVPVGIPDEYKGCTVGKYTPRKADLNGEDMQRIVIEWEVPAP